MNEIQKKFPNASASFRRRNPHLFSAPVGAIQGAQREQAAQDALGRTTKRETKSKVGAHKSNSHQNVQCGWRVTLIVSQRILQDSDRCIGGLTVLRDAIADILLPDICQRYRDSDDLIAWEYGQIRTRGEEGVAVRIEKL